MSIHASRIIIVASLCLIIFSGCTPVSVDGGFITEANSPTNQVTIPAYESDFSIGDQEALLSTQMPMLSPTINGNTTTPAPVLATPTARVFTVQEWRIPEDCTAVPQAEFEIELVALINAERTDRDLTPLEVEPRLVSVARRHTTDMACNRFFSHTGSDGTSPFARIPAEDYTFSIAGENIYGGKEHHNDPAAALLAWMRSSSHRAVLMHPDFCHIGAAYLFNSNSRFGGYTTAVFGCPD